MLGTYLGDWNNDEKTEGEKKTAGVEIAIGWSLAAARKISFHPICAGTFPDYVFGMVFTEVPYMYRM